MGGHSEKYIHIKVYQHTELGNSGVGKTSPKKMEDTRGQKFTFVQEQAGGKIPSVKWELSHGIEVNCSAMSEEGKISWGWGWGSLWGFIYC